MVFQILGIHFAYSSCCYVGQTSDKLSGCQEQPVCIKLVNLSIFIKVKKHNNRKRFNFFYLQANIDYQTISLFS